MDDFKSDVFTLYRSHSKKRCSEYFLVLRAMGIHCEVLPLGDEFALLVYAHDADRAQEQLDLYLHENSVGSSQFEPGLSFYDGLNCACLYGLTILVMDFLQQHRAFSLDWWDAGKGDAGLIQHGEWWRTLTSLSLHADPAHLAGNLVFGVLIGFLIGHRLGWGLALFGMLVAGAVGNLINAFIQPAEHVSIGASTAVFAALGILSIYTWQQRQHLVNRLAPVGSGVALLAFLGMGGAQTDIFAHLSGFGSGCLFGVLFGILRRRLNLHERCQFALGFAGVTVFVVSWSLALQAHG